MIEIELGEWSRCTAAVGEPTRDDLDLAGRLNDDLGSKLQLRWLRDGRLDVTSRAWVGVVRLSSVTIRVRPKFAGYELGVIRMLQYAGSLASLRRTVSSRSLNTEGRDLVDLICALLADEVQVLLRDGLLHDYTTEEASLPALRGSLRYREQATKRFGQLDVLECRYDEFHADVIENQLVAAGLTVASRVCGDRDVKHRVRRLLGATTEIASVGPSDVDYYRERLSYGRRNERYRDAHELSLLLLSQLAVGDLYSSGRTESFAFLLDMNVIFERFMTAVVREAFAAETWGVTSQGKIRSVIKRRDTGRVYSSIIPDLVLSDGQDHIPFDCKYKLYGDKRKLSTGDIYQAFLYAFALSAQSYRGARAGIVYPDMRSRLEPLLEVRQMDGPTAASLTGIGVNLLGLERSLGEPAEWQQRLHEIRRAFTPVVEAQ